MRLISGVIFCFTALALSSATSVVTVKRIATDQLLLRSLLQNRANNYAAPCFDLYVPIFDAILQEFSDSYQQCGKEAQSEMDALNAEATGNRTLMTSTSQSVCSSMTECSQLDDSLAFFDCYSGVGSDNVRTIYNLTNNATELAAVLREQTLVIEANLNVCQNASERSFNENMGTANEALNSCLLNGPPEIVSTTTEAAEATTTVGVETTTVPPEIVSTTTEAAETTTTVVVETTTVPVASEDEALVEVEDLSRSVNTVPKINPKHILRGIN